MNYDYAVIGSGFGGSVAALRLAEKGYRVVVLEQGSWVSPSDMEESSKSIRKLFWMPGLGMKGFFYQEFFKHVNIVGGVGVGGGSLVYAAVLLEPKDAFYRDPSWSRLGVDWKKELKPFYSRVSRMLGIEKNPNFSIQDEYLKQTAEKMNAGKTFGPTPNGIYFGTAEVMKPDPYFGGDGPARTGCHLCGECLTGCKFGSKNMLDKNYLFMAQKHGAVIMQHRKVTCITPLKDGGYTLTLRNSLKPGQKLTPVTATGVVLAGGVLGTLELLFRCRDVTKTLPNISKKLGKVVRTNSEAIVAALSNDKELDGTKGTTISSEFYPDRYTHITQNRFPRGYSFMRFLGGPLVDSNRPIVRSMMTFGKILINPASILRQWFARNWYKRVTVLTVMQNLDNQIQFTYGLSAMKLFLGRRLKSKRVRGKEAPTNLPVANRAAKALAEVSGGRPINVITESLLNQSTTAHILGGCNIGTSAENGVIDKNQMVFGYPGLYVTDGAAVSANVGVNPSLTIAAMAERAMSLIPGREKSSGKTPAKKKKK